MTASLAARAGEREPWSYEQFEVGGEIGRTTLVFDRRMSDQWSIIFGPAVSDTDVPMAAVPLLLMRAFANAVTPRPPGNLHVGQRCDLRTLPRIGQQVIAEVRCHGKERRGERRVVQFEVEIFDAGRQELLCSGLTTIFWAL